MDKFMDIKTVQINNPESQNLIFGQSHFIKTVEDLHEAIVVSVGGIKFGLAFCEASGDRILRSSGTDAKLVKLAQDNLMTIAAGHTFIIFLGNAYPINVLNAIKMVPEVVRIFCATANPVEVIVAQTDQGRGVLGVVDGGMPTRIENEKDIVNRKKLLRDFGYKL
jgi:uncharacterized protein